MCVFFTRVFFCFSFSAIGKYYGEEDQDQEERNTRHSNLLFHPLSSSFKHHWSPNKERKKSWMPRSYFKIVIVCSSEFFKEFFISFESEKIKIKGSMTVLNVCSPLHFDFQCLKKESFGEKPIKRKIFIQSQRKKICLSFYFCWQCFFKKKKTKREKKIWGGVEVLVIHF